MSATTTNASLPEAGEADLIGRPMLAFSGSAVRSAAFDDGEPGEADLRRLAICLAAGIRAKHPHARALLTTARQMTNRRLRFALLEAAAELTVVILRQQALTLSQALRMRTDAFPESFCRLVEAGELGGEVAALLEEYAGRNSQDVANAALAFIQEDAVECFV